VLNRCYGVVFVALKPVYQTVEQLRIERD
jgi:hypothetical protein